MKHVELDAAERRERKQQDSEHANKLKEKGNNSFKRKDFNEAIGYYDEAIRIIRDNTVLYTNRAQVWKLHSCCKYKLFCFNIFLSISEMGRKMSLILH